MSGLLKLISVLVLAVIVSGVLDLRAPAQTNSVMAPAASKPPSVRKLKAVDADGHTVLINRPGMITLLLGTNEESQDAARSAGIAAYPFQGRPDFQLIVVVDLRNSIATWAPSIVISQMKSNLDHEAIELKPYFLKNGNKSNPRLTTHVIPDFSGTICPQLGWPDGSDSLRGILFGVNGREIKRWDKIEDMDKMEADVRAAIQALIDADKAKAADAVKAGGTKLIQPVVAHPPILPYTPAPKSD